MKALITVDNSSLVLTLNKDTMKVSSEDFRRLIDVHTTKENFIDMASQMTKDFLQMEGKDWDFDEKEIQRKLSVIYDSIILKYHINTYL